MTVIRPAVPPDVTVPSTLPLVSVEPDTIEAVVNPLGDEAAEAVGAAPRLAAPGCFRIGVVKVALVDEELVRAMMPITNPAMAIAATISPTNHQEVAT